MHSNKKYADVTSLVIKWICSSVAVSGSCDIC